MVPLRRIRRDESLAIGMELPVLAEVANFGSLAVSLEPHGFASRPRGRFAVSVVVPGGIEKQERSYWL